MTFAWGLVHFSRLAHLIHLVHWASTAYLLKRLSQVISIHFIDLGSLGILGSLGKVVGGGNYVEHQSLQDWAQNSGRQAVVLVFGCVRHKAMALGAQRDCTWPRQVTYGSTDIVSPVQFVDELSHLGQTLGQGWLGCRVQVCYVC